MTTDRDVRFLCVEHNILLKLSKSITEENKSNVSIVAIKGGRHIVFLYLYIHSEKKLSEIKTIQNTLKVIGSFQNPK